MTINENLPLLLLDNSSMMSVLNEGEFKCYNVSFEEAKTTLEMYDEDHILRCFSNIDLETVMFDYLGMTKRDCFQVVHNAFGNTTGYSG